MSIYYEEEQKKKRWESGQAILHREAPGAGSKSGRQDREAFSVKNSYGNLRYLKKDEKRGHGREGLALEAFEAPGTRAHSEKEKYLDRKTMKKVRRSGELELFSSELPFRDQALFTDMGGNEKSEEFLECMKELMNRQGHRTLRDTFGFLEQEPERAELEQRREEQRDALSPESVQEQRQLQSAEGQREPGKRIDTLSSRLLRKEAMERRLCSELQLMLDQRDRKEQKEGGGKSPQTEQERSRQTEPEQSRQTEGNGKDGGFWQRRRQPQQAEPELPSSGEAEDSEQSSTEDAKEAEQP